MFKKILTAAAIATVVTVGAVGTTTAPAEAGTKFHFSVGGPYWGPGHYGHGYYGNPCRKFKRAYHRTGRYRYLRKYRRCMRHWY